MGVTVTQLYRQLSADRAYCFHIESSRNLSPEETTCLRLILADGFLLQSVQADPVPQGTRVVEVGPRLNFATAWSSNMVSICRATGLDAITRVERSRRYLVAEGEDLQAFIDRHHDRMTECHYPAPLTSFETGVVPEPVYEVDLKAKGPEALSELPGISMDERDRKLYYDYFVNRQGRNPTIVEIMDLNNANSEHSRHGFLRADRSSTGKKWRRPFLTW